MVTADEIGSIASSPAFPTPTAGGSRARRRTSRARPAITPRTRGGERALFAVLGGKIEAVKLVDGITRRRSR